MKVNEVIKEVTDRVQETANVKVVFGDPVENGDVTVIPVASVKVSGGGGGGTDEPKNSMGMGMGLGISTAPVGYIEIKDDEARFVNIIDSNKIISSAAKVLSTLIFMVTMVRVIEVRRESKRLRKLSKSTGGAA